MTSNEQRRKEIFDILNESEKAISATALAEKFSVTRQIIVADIALLRAAGNPIRSEHRGYVLDKPRAGIYKKIVCRHRQEDVQDEFYAVVDNGGVLLDVQVEHPIYGQISANLSITSRRDADAFLTMSRLSGASQLSDLTGGVHIHTVIVQSEDDFNAICERLKRLGILITEY